MWLLTFIDKPTNNFNFTKILYILYFTLVFVCVDIVICYLKSLLPKLDTFSLKSLNMQNISLF